MHDSLLSETEQTEETEMISVISVDSCSFNPCNPATVQLGKLFWSRYFELAQSNRAESSFTRRHRVFNVSPLFNLGLVEKQFNGKPKGTARNGTPLPSACCESPD